LRGKSGNIPDFSTAASLINLLVASLREAHRAQIEALPPF
jgi:hypothetical protein